MKRLNLQSVRLSLAVMLLGTGAPGWVQAGSDTAVIVMTHGETPGWSRMVKQAVKGAKLPCPYAVFYGMGATADERKRLQSGLIDLEGKGAHTVYVIPFLISNYSDVARQWKYLFGVDVQPGFINTPLFPLEKRATIQYADPLNDSTVAVEILLDRAHEVSSEPSKESVIVVASGPSDESDNRRWGQILQNLSNAIQKRGGYATVEGFTLREGAPTPIRRQSMLALRNRAEAIDREGRRAIIVLYSLAPGGVGDKIGLELRGLNYTLNTKALLPDTRISEWVRSQVP